MIGASVLVISYGYQIREEGHDPFVELVKNSAEDFAQAAMTGAFLVDIIPACRCCSVSWRLVLNSAVTRSTLHSIMAPGWKVASKGFAVQGPTRSCARGDIPVRKDANSEPRTRERSEYF